VLHPELSFEDDVRDLLKVNEELARLLLEDQEAARCDMGIRLFQELTELRELNERHELEVRQSASPRRRRPLPAVSANYCGTLRDAYLA
jgi:hypothetical protein